MDDEPGQKAGKRFLLLPLGVVLLLALMFFSSPAISSGCLTLNQRARLEGMVILQAAIAFHDASGRWPTMAELRAPGPNGKTFLRASAEDPWGGPYRLLMSPDGAPTVISAGPDGVPDTADDIIVAPAESGPR
jgi:hypothetical protein